MMKLKNMMKLGIGTTALAVSLHASAMLIPVTDYANLADKIYENIQASLAAAVKEVFRDTVFDMTGQAAKDQVDTVNNGAANAIARINKVATDLQNLTQLERSQPSRDACSATVSSKAFTDALCDQGSLQADRDTLINSVSTGLSSLYAKIGSGASSVTGLITNADSTGGSEETLSEKAMKEYVAKQVAAYDTYKAWSDAGKDDVASNPNLLMPMGNYNPQFSEEDLKMAQNYAFITYPPYIRKNTTDPTSTAEIEAELRLKNATNLVGAVITRQAEMRTPPSAGQMSKLSTLELQTALRFTDDGKLSGDTNSWLERTTQDSSYSTHAINRDGAIMKSIKIKQMIDRYESSLIRERLLATYVLNQLNEPQKNL
ncbi:hypothetical protein [Pseudomonas amygdali]|uniref:Uncharacterized protein n=2 Tax=Pseudomonas amygdali pv. lachrymans TaxID=53707 RepID=A0ABR5KT07_PSEAV|nr:hypothetical protein [Pseudomonas amygdali]KPC16878.1 Uncharacterized protein AC499_0080 [Pseudomonas amygdali pv. lachrymans]KPC17837.1 Uncharacterized protein AC499_1039 [Pseudomonas amygdali pv. lachrymans]RMT06068.1 hypothetical protein ALP54_03380 [Pseudomonas amygdali pv. lachrymans]